MIVNSGMAETGVRLHVEADLSVSIEGVDGMLSGSGSELEFATDDLAPFFRGGPGRTTKTRGMGEQLAAAGLSIDVVEGGRPVVSLGAERSSILGRLTGAPHLTPHRPLRLLGLLLAGR